MSLFGVEIGQQLGESPHQNRPAAARRRPVAMRSATPTMSPPAVQVPTTRWIAVLRVGRNTVGGTLPCLSRRDGKNACGA